MFASFWRMSVFVLQVRLWVELLLLLRFLRLHRAVMEPGHMGQRREISKLETVYSSSLGCRGIGYGLYQDITEEFFLRF